MKRDWLRKALALLMAALLLVSAGIAEEAVVEAEAAATEAEPQVEVGEVDILAEQALYTGDEALPEGEKPVGEAPQVEAPEAVEAAPKTAPVEVELSVKQTYKLKAATEATYDTGALTVGAEYGCKVTNGYGEYTNMPFYVYIENDRAGRDRRQRDSRPSADRRESRTDGSQRNDRGAGE